MWFALGMSFFCCAPLEASKQERPLALPMTAGRTPQPPKTHSRYRGKGAGAVAG